MSVPSTYWYWRSQQSRLTARKCLKTPLKRNWIEHSRPSLISRTYMYTIYLIHDVLDKRSC